MPQYYLQFGFTDATREVTKETPSGVLIENEPRFFLDDHVHRDAKVHAEVHAASWIQAREHPLITEYTPPIYFS